MPDPIREALERAAQIIDTVKQNDAALDAHRRLVLAVCISAQLLGRDITQDVATTLAARPELAPAAPKVGAAPTTAKDMDILRY